MKRHHYGILALTLLLLGGLAGYSLVKNNIIPIAWVNGHIIFLHEVQESAAISQRLYTQAPQLVDDDPELAAVLKDGDQETLFARALQSSILHAIIRTSAPDDARDRASNEAQAAIAQVDRELFDDLLTSQYSWDIETFQRRIVEPQVLQDILLETHGEGYDTWVDAAKNSANVRIWFVPFEWQNGELVGE